MKRFIRCLILPLLWTAPAWAAGSHCDPALPAAPNHPIAYRERGDRCEGLYDQMVGALHLEAVLTRPPAASGATEHDAAPAGALVAGDRTGRRCVRAVGERRLGEGDALPLAVAASFPS